MAIHHAAGEVEVDTSHWSGDGSLTQQLVERLSLDVRIHTLRVEDAPSSRTEPGYLFVSNELFIVPVAVAKPSRSRWWHLRAETRNAAQALTLPDVDAWLSHDPSIGRPDFADAGMLQFLRTERIIPPYQTRGYKLIELVRVYLSGNAERPSDRNL